MNNARLVGEYALGIDTGIAVRESFQSEDTFYPSDMGFGEKFAEFVIPTYMQAVSTLGAYIFRSTSNSVGKIYEESHRMNYDASWYVAWGRVVANIVTGAGIDVLRIGAENYVASSSTLNHFPILLTLATLHTLGNAVTGIYNISKGRGRTGTFSR